jgi:short-subunit dehydrogenase
MDLQLKDKVAVVTGGTVGIGLAIARGLAAEGAHLVLCARDEERLRAVATELRDSFGVRVAAVAADVGSADGTDRVGPATASAPPTTSTAGG